MLMMTRARTRSGLDSANPRPVGPPQSWQTTVALCRSSCRSRLVRFAMWPSRVWACSRTGFSERPNPIMSGTMTRRPAEVSGFTNLR